MILETQKADVSAFISLTYRDEELSLGGDCHPSLMRSDLQNWLKRLRKQTKRKIRYYYCGEYGDRFDRPHYHAILWGFPPCSYGKSRYSQGVLDCCWSCDTIRDTWKMGIIECSVVTPARCAYTAGYVMKKMKTKDLVHERKVKPEFQGQSLKPGIGFGAVQEIARTVTTTDLDVPSFVMGPGRKKMPLGRYLRKEVRKACGRDEKTPLECIDQWEIEMLAMWSRQKEALGDECLSFKKANSNVAQGKIDSMRARESIYDSRRKLREAKQT